MSAPATAPLWLAALGAAPLQLGAALFIAVGALILGVGLGGAMGARRRLDAWLGALTLLGVGLALTTLATGGADIGVPFWLLALRTRSVAQLVRGRTLVYASTELATAQRALGAGALHVLRRGVLPLTWSSLAGHLAQTLAWLTVLGALLTHLGLLPPGAPAAEGSLAWGALLAAPRHSPVARLALLALALLPSAWLAWRTPSTTPPASTWP